MTSVPTIFPIVGIGASAGGLEAFTHLLAALPDHRHPERRLHLGGKLAGKGSEFAIYLPLETLKAMPSALPQLVNDQYKDLEIHLLVTEMVIAGLAHAVRDALDASPVAPIL